jgi:hypothetical protein
MALMAIGDMPHHRVARTMELFASHVMPSYRTTEEKEELAAVT